MNPTNTNVSRRRLITGALAAGEADQSRHASIPRGRRSAKSNQGPNQAIGCLLVL